MVKAINYSLQLITDSYLYKNDLLENVVEQAIKGGVTLVQMRNKELNTRNLLEIGKRLKKLLQRYQIPFIVNDRIDLVLALDADGVHLGQDDLPYDVARRILGKNKIIGLSINTIEQLKQANQWDVDYLGIGPIFPTASKLDAKPPLGIATLKVMRSISNHKLIAIGGINIKNLDQIMQTNIDGIAIISAICASFNPEQSALQLSRKLGIRNETL